jgi:hypothetical protein
MGHYSTGREKSAICQFADAEGNNATPAGSVWLYATDSARARPIDIAAGRRTRSGLMHKPRLVLALIAVVTVPLAVQAGPSVQPDRDQLDAVVASIVEGGIIANADDATFLRRVWVDLAGHVPPALLVREFLDDKNPEKRARMVDRLLDSADFADHWARVVAIWMTAQRPIASDSYDGRVLHQFLSDRLRERVPYDRIVRELIAGTGASDASGPANFILRYQADPARLAGAVGKNLLGITLQCAQCHDHRFARWKEEDFWGLAAAFARVRKMEGGGDDNLKAIVEARRGELMRPDPAAPADAELEGEDEDDEAAETGPKKVAVRPRLLDGKPVLARDRRSALAAWVVARDNPYFARNLVNRVWEQLFGKALVPNLDNLAAKADSLPVLSLLAEDLTANNHDLRHLLRTIVLSKTYGQPASPRARPSWGRPLARPMAVDQLHASIAQATGHDGAPAQVAESPIPAADDPHAEDPALADDGELAADAQDVAVESIGERSLTLQRALVLLNGEFVHEAARTAARVSRAVLGRTNDSDRIEWACLATLGRKPSVEELGVLRPLLNHPNGLEDVYWVLINSAEFQGIH